MHIQFTMEGGIAYFPGMSQPVTIDTDALPVEEAKALERLIEEARFFALPTSAAAPPRGAADYRQYTLSVATPGRRHTVQMTDPVEDPHVRALVDHLKTKAREWRTKTKQKPR